MMTDSELLALEALRNQLQNLEETIGRLHRLTLEAPRDRMWDKVRDEVSALDSIGDVIRRVLDWVEEEADPGWPEGRSHKG